MSDEKTRLITFHNVQAAMGAERTLKARGLSLDLIPLPRAISSDCGFCLLVAEGEGLVLDFEYEGVYLVTETDLPARARKEKHYERER